MNFKHFFMDLKSYFICVKDKRVNSPTSQRNMNLCNVPDLWFGTPSNLKMSSHHHTTSCIGRNECRH